MIIRQPPRPQSAFVSVPNAWARDSRLTLRARGLLVQLLSHVDGWETSIAELASLGSEKRDAINGAMAELKKYGYVTSERVNLGGGRLDAIITIHDSPSPSTDSPYTAEPSTGAPSTAEPPAYKKTSHKKTSSQKTTSQKPTEPPRIRAATSAQSSYAAGLLRQLAALDELPHELSDVDLAALTAEEADGVIKLAKDLLHHAKFIDGDGGERLGDAYPQLRADLAERRAPAHG